MTLYVDNLYLERPPTPIGKAERRERIALALMQQMAWLVIEDEMHWGDISGIAVNGANALIESLDAAAAADTKGEVTT